MVTQYKLPMLELQEVIVMSILSTRSLMRLLVNETILNEVIYG